MFLNILLISMQMFCNAWLSYFFLGTSVAAQAKSGTYARPLYICDRNPNSLTILRNTMSSFWQDNKGTFKKAGIATARGIGQGTKAASKAAYSYHKKSEARRKGLPPPEEPSYSKSGDKSDPAPSSETPAYTRPPPSQPTMSPDQLRSLPPPPKRNVGAYEVPKLGEQSQYTSSQPPATYQQPEQQQQQPPQQQQQQPPLPPQSQLYANQYQPSPDQYAGQAQPAPVSYNPPQPPSAPLSGRGAPPPPPRTQLVASQQPVTPVSAPPLAHPSQQQSPPEQQERVPKPVPDASMFAPPPIHRDRGKTEAPPKAGSTSQSLSGVSAHLTSQADSQEAPTSPTKVINDSGVDRFPPPPPVRTGQAPQGPPLQLPSRQAPPSLPSRRSSSSSTQSSTPVQPSLPSRNSGVSVNKPVKAPPPKPLKKPGELSAKPPMPSRPSDVQLAGGPPPMPSRPSQLTVNSEQDPPPPPPYTETSDRSVNEADVSVPAPAPAPASEPNFAEQIARLRPTKSNVLSGSHHEETEEAPKPVKQAPPKPAKPGKPAKPAKPLLLAKPTIGPKPSVAKTEGEVDESNIANLRAGLKSVKKPSPVLGEQAKDGDMTSAKGPTPHPVPPSPSQPKPVKPSPPVSRKSASPAPALNTNRAVPPPPPSRKSKSPEAPSASATPPPPPKRNYLRAAAPIPAQATEPPALDLELHTGWYAKLNDPLPLPKACEGLNYSSSYQYSTKTVAGVPTKDSSRDISLRLKDLSKIKYKIQWKNDDASTATAKVEEYMPSPLHTRIPGRSDLVSWSQQYGEHVASWAERHMGQQVGRGECWDLAHDALEKGCGNHAFVSTYYHHGFPILEIQGSPSGPPTVIRGPNDETRRGDILQFTSAKFENKATGATQTAGAPDHTSVVIGKEGEKLIVAEQNVGGVRTVIKGAYVLGSIVDGTVAVYRPVPKQWAE